MNERYDFGDWWTVIFFIAFFLIFALSFTRPNTTRDWRSFGAFAGFIVALFVEMYGFPLTLYLLSGWIESNFPSLEIFTHRTGHLWHALLGLQGDAHGHAIDNFASVLILAGLVLLGFAWRGLYKAQQAATVARTGAYRLIRHPQYVAFILVMFGYLLTWPTIPTLIMFPILVFMYVRLAGREEREVMTRQGGEYLRYVAATPAFLPRVWPSRKSDEDI